VLIYLKFWDLGGAHRALTVVDRIGTTDILRALTTSLLKYGQKLNKEIMQRL
jgi:hypothetical protein